LTAAELRAWLERRGLSERAAAPLLAAAQQEVNRWARGERRIPRRVVRIIELLDRIEELEP
jgi:DNA-binding transcriptional regulator YdaS (Cro superfamily)